MNDFPPYRGELGWEMFGTIPYYRFISWIQGRRLTLSSYPCMAPLYADFADFVPHNFPERNSPGEGAEKRCMRYLYDFKGRYLKYGRYTASLHYDVLIHPRGIAHNSQENYHRWSEVVKELRGLKVAIVGTHFDQFVPDVDDLRDIDMAKLVDVMASSSVIVGRPSGPIHIAQQCCMPVVVWYKKCLAFGETQEIRMRERWNPFKTPVYWVPGGESFDPAVREVVKGIESFL